MFRIVPWNTRMKNGFSILLHEKAIGFYFYWEFNKKFKDYWFLNLYINYHKEPAFPFFRRFFFNRQISKYSSEYRKHNKYENFDTEIPAITYAYEQDVFNGGMSFVLGNKFAEISSWCSENCKSKWFIEDYNYPPKHIVNVLFEDKAEAFLYRMSM